MKLLLIEDDLRIGGALQQFLTESGDFCRWARDGQQGLELVRSQEYDVVILDILLPDRDGLEILRLARGEGILTPVILLTALGRVDQRVTGLSRGADDYLVKPFEFAELHARVKAISRRSQLRPSPVVEVGDIQLDLSARKVSCAGSEIGLTPTEASLLELLMRYAGQLVTRKMIGRHLWDDEWDSSTNVVDVHITRLRGKLDRGLPQNTIHTVRGRGYVFRSP